jgi:phage terminase large subunit
MIMMTSNPSPLLTPEKSNHQDYSLTSLTKPQRKIMLYGSTYRFRVVVAGRRFGKTVLGVTECLYHAQKAPKQLVWYIAPTYRMAKELVWEELKEAIPKENIAYKNESELSITLKNGGSKIVLKGADNPDTLRGKGLNFVVFDEVADISSETWFKVIYPALTDKQGHALFIGTPKGYNWFYDLFLFAQSEENPNWYAFSYTTSQGGNVTPQELEYAKMAMSHKQYQQEFEASFETLMDRVYSAFDRHQNVDPGVADYGQPLLVGMDFNINPMSAVIAQRVANELHVFNEIEISNGNTDEMCRELIARYPNRDITVYPDPSGKSRKTSSPIGQTDHSIIRAYGFDIQAPNKAPLIVDRVNETNALCCNASNERRLLLHPRCIKTIKSLEGLTFKEGTSIPDKNSGLDHMVDALGYLIHMEFPINHTGMMKLKLGGL